ncbi:MAG: transcription termination/antitermination protein NusA [Chloroflexi bacterium]|nr:transcription termination/antitermination protein NusA [Anaerolinea sp.]TDA63769.1 MAG: transcription termination/antitermination protein NusA [Chloroflexota bacterium]
MKNEFTLAFNEVIEEKQLGREVILKALESAMVSAYRRAVNASNAQHVESKVDTETGKVTIYAEKEVVESVQETTTEVTLEDARLVNPEAQLGDMVIVESTPKDFGRVAAQTARQVIQQRIRDAERQAQLDFYMKQMGEIVSGVVQAVGAQGLTIGLEMKAEGSMPRKELIPGERPRIHERVRALVAEVKDNPRGPQIILSRTHRNFLRRLLENEVPEIYHGVVEIRSIAREPGERAKVAVSATQPGIDPVGACVGIRGVRIQAIVRELHDEKIDVIEWNSDQAAFIAKAISPARVNGVYLNDRNAGGKTATVVVPEDQLSLAIGRDGQNARLAAKLTGWRIDIKSLPEAAADVLNRLQKDEELVSVAQQEADVMAKVEEYLARKAEGRPLAPEEYELLVRFVDRVERRSSARPAVEKAVVAEIENIRALIPADAFELSILDSGLPEHVAYILQEAGFSTLGEMAVQMKIRPDDILRLNGIGPRALQEINNMVAALDERKAGEIAAAEEAAKVATEVEPVPTEPVLTEATPEVAETTEPIEIAAPVEEIEPVVAEATPVVTEPAVAVDAEAEEEEIPFDKLFELRTAITTPVASDEEEEEEDDASGKDKKKGKKKKKHVQVEYDPEKDQTIVLRKHRREGEDWDWDS